MLYRLDPEDGIGVSEAIDPRQAAIIESMRLPKRYEFTDADLSKDWDVTIGAGMTVTAGNGVLTITTGTTAGAITELVSKEIYRLPMALIAGVRLTQRIINQNFVVELISIDPATGQPDGMHMAGNRLQATVATSAIAETRNGGLARLSQNQTIFTTASLTNLVIEATTDETVFTGRGYNSNAARSGNAVVFSKPSPDPSAFYRIRIRAANRQLQQITNVANNGSGACRVTTSVAHGLSNGDPVVVSEVQGATGANGEFTVTVIDTTNIDLDGSTFGGTYQSFPHATGVLFSGNAPSSSTSFDVAYISVEDYNELQAEITGGRGNIAASNALPVALVASGNVVAGPSSHDGVGSAAALMPVGLHAHNAAPAAVSANLDVTRMQGDMTGRAVVSVGAVVQSQDRNRVVLSNTTETTLIAAVASARHVIHDLVIANLNTTNPVQVDLRDTTAGTIRATFQVPAGQSIPFSSTLGLAQGAVNTNWTVQATGTTPNVAISANSARVLT
jgi:hypothetical protein